MRQVGRNRILAIVVDAGEDGDSCYRCRFYRVDPGDMCTLFDIDMYDVRGRPRECKDAELVLASQDED